MGSVGHNAPVVILKYDRDKDVDADRLDAEETDGDSVAQFFSGRWKVRTGKMSLFPKPPIGSTPACAFKFK